MAAHESTYINNVPQLAVFIRGVETFDVTEELLDMVPPCQAQHKEMNYFYVLSKVLKNLM